MFPQTSCHFALRQGAVAAAILTLVIPAQVPADGTQRTGRYLDRSVFVNEAPQLNPLQQVASLAFSSRIWARDRPGTFCRYYRTAPRSALGREE